MFTLKKTPTALDQEIERVLEKLKTTPPQSTEYEKISDNLVKLHKMKTDQSASGVSKDAALTSATHIAGLLLVINHERVHVIATRAFSMIRKS